MEQNTKRFKFETDEFPWVLKAFKEETPLGGIKRKEGQEGIYQQQFLDEGLVTHVSYGTENHPHVALQFHGWEIVLLPDGHYFINDTSGG